MKIVDNRNSHDVRFGELNPGDTFVFANTYYMVVIDAVTREIRAIELLSGIICDFDDVSVVRPVTAVVTIDN